MGHYKANVRDIEFNLFEALDLGPMLDSGSVGELDSATARDSLNEVARLAEGPIAASFEAGDRAPSTLFSDEHTIRGPEPIRGRVRAVWTAEWWRVGIAGVAGGVGVP